MKDYIDVVGKKIYYLNDTLEITAQDETYTQTGPEKWTIDTQTSPSFDKIPPRRILKKYQEAEISRDQEEEEQPSVVEEHKKAPLPPRQRNVPQRKVRDMSLQEKLLEEKFESFLERKKEVEQEVRYQTVNVYKKIDLLSSCCTVLVN
jgi:hypothetical protein